MNCPDVGQLELGDPEALEHAADCKACSSRLDVISEIRATFNPTGDMPEGSLQGILIRLEGERKRERETNWGRFATFLLSIATALPVVLAASSQQGGGMGGLGKVTSLIIGTAVFVCLVESRLVKER